MLRSTCEVKVTTGLNSAPEIGPSTSIGAQRATPVATAFSSNERCRPLRRRRRRSSPTGARVDDAQLATGQFDVGEDGVDLPRLTRRAVDPHLVQAGVAAGHLVLGRRLEAFSPESAGGGGDLDAALDLDAACCAPSLLTAPLGASDAAQLAKVFAVLADPVRLRCLSLIATAGECCSCDLDEPLQRSQPTTSRHTKALADAGLIVGERRGRWMWWRIVPERVEAMRQALAPR